MKRSAARKKKSDPAEIRARIGGNVRRLRVLRGWSQGTLAERMGVQIPRVSEVERGVTDARLQTLVRFANALEVSINELFAPQRSSQP
jgi:transcriptional regulator with XRE-family HTH domain